MTQETYPSRSAWRRAFNQRRAGYLSAHSRFIDGAPHEAPSSFRAPYSSSQWIALTPEARLAHAREKAREFVAAKIGPMPEPAVDLSLRRAMTLDQLEAVVIQRADEHAADLRFILTGDPDQVEAIVAAQLPTFRAKVFDELIRKYAIYENV